METKSEALELNELLKHQDCLKIPEEIYRHAKTATSFFMLVCDLFNYGYIMGKRAERARWVKHNFFPFLFFLL